VQQTHSALAIIRSAGDRGGGDKSSRIRGEVNWEDLSVIVGNVGVRKRERGR